eukprot:COSAG01_NODE_2402_length_7759_cov_9.960313_8_plen_125_part_00
MHPSIADTACEVLDTDTGKPPKRRFLDSTIQFCPDLADIAGWSCSLATSATLLIGAGGSETPDATLLKVWRIDDFIAIIFLLASASFFLINDGDKMEFAWDQEVIGPVWREFWVTFATHSSLLV